MIHWYGCNGDKQQRATKKKPGFISSKTGHKHDSMAQANSAVSGAAELAFLALTPQFELGQYSLSKVEVAYRNNFKPEILWI